MAVSMITGTEFCAACYTGTRMCPACATAAAGDDDIDDEADFEDARNIDALLDDEEAPPDTASRRVRKG